MHYEGQSALTIVTPRGIVADGVRAGEPPGGGPVLFAPVVELVVPLPPQAVKSSISPSIAIQMRQ